MPRKYIPKAINDELDTLSKGYCEYCKFMQIYSHDSFVTEHIIPLFLEGSNKLDNLARACGGCNGFKHTFVSAVDPISKKTIPLFHPRKEKWENHFTWSTDFLRIIGLTPTGRATVTRLQLNRPQLINFRKIALGFGHPPS